MMNYQDEKIKIKRYILIIILTAAVFISFAMIVLCLLNNSHIQDSKKYLKETSLHYVELFDKQFNYDIETLRGISLFIDEHHSEEDILDKLVLENQQNRFVRLGYVNSEYQGFIVDINGDVRRNVDFSQEDYVIKAFDGKPQISSILDDKYSQEKVIYYSVPIINDNKVEGVIVATNTLDILNDIIYQPYASDYMVTFIIDENGVIIQESQDKGRKGECIYQDSFASRDIQKKLESKQSIIFESTMDNTRYWSYIVPLNIDNGYILTVLNQSHLQDEIKSSMILVVVITLLLMMSFTGILLYMYHTIHKNRENIYYLAYHDTKTGAYNRNGIEYQYKHILKKEESYCALIMNICHFKFINHTFGFHVGDQLLKYMKECIEDILDKDEIFYHSQADRFGIIMKQDHLEQRLSQLMHRMENYLSKMNYPIYCHFGVSMMDINQNTITLDTFFDQARLALQTIQQVHGHNIAYYNQDIYNEFKHRNDVEILMEQALENNEYRLFIQPKFDLSTKCICGGEALVRWKKTDGSYITPSEFISIFETNGFVSKLDLYMFEKLCQYQKDRKERGLKIYPISINQSRLLFYKKDYIQLLQETISKYDVNPHMIIIEVTEGLFFDDLDKISCIINQLHEIGFKISVDDFGSGYSSFDIIKEFDVDELKLDKLFMMDYHDQKRGRIMVECILSMAKKLGIKTVCEGIENQEQVNILEKLGCDILQGYFFGKPLDIESFEKIIDRGENNV